MTTLRQWRLWLEEQSPMANSPLMIEGAVLVGAGDLGQYFRWYWGSWTVGMEQAGMKQRHFLPNKLDMR